MSMRWRALLLCLLLLILPFGAFTEQEFIEDDAWEPAAELEAPPVLRALVVTCDLFSTADSTAPSARGNAAAMEMLLHEDARGYEKIVTAVNQTGDKPALRRFVDEAFSNAVQNDVSLVYLSTHGEYDGERPFCFLLSGGGIEWRMTAEDLYDMLKDIPGTKLIVADACYSGMLIGKGAGVADFYSPFMRPGFKVLTSAGGRELSFNWASGTGEQTGGSYFMLALLQGLGEGGRHQADMNGDGAVTLREAREYLREGYGASGAQVYPENDDFVLFYCRMPAENAPINTVTDLTFDETVLSAGERELSFSYTLNRPARLAYRLVYEKDGEWRFDTPEIFEEGGGRDGLVRPGRKQRSLTLGAGDKVYGYVLFFLVAMEHDRVEPLASAIITVEDTVGETARAMSASHFYPEEGQEMPIHIVHDKPCSYSVRIRNGQGEVVAAPWTDVASRPLRMSPEGSMVYWNGRDVGGALMPPGLYWAEVLVKSGDKSVLLFTDAFALEYRNESSRAE